jgi:hypothetical protein
LPHIGIQGKTGFGIYSVLEAFQGEQRGIELMPGITARIRESIPPYSHVINCLAACFAAAAFLCALPYCRGSIAEAFFASCYIAVARVLAFSLATWPRNRLSAKLAFLAGILIAFVLLHTVVEVASRYHFAAQSLWAIVVAGLFAINKQARDNPSQTLLQDN